MRRILVIGKPGGGKSTLARRLGDREVAAFLVKP
jgi:adenylate kinase family enzyme